MKKLPCPTCGELLVADDEHCRVCRRPSTIAEREAAAIAAANEPVSEDEMVAVHGIDPATRGPDLWLYVGLGLLLLANLVYFLVVGPPFREEVAKQRARVAELQNQPSRATPAELDRERRELEALERSQRFLSPHLAVNLVLLLLGAILGWRRPFHGALLVAVGSTVLYVGAAVYSPMSMLVGMTGKLLTPLVSLGNLYPAWRLHRFRRQAADRPGPERSR
jgi:hypothetical protein